MHCKQLSNLFIICSGCCWFFFSSIVVFKRASIWIVSSSAWHSTSWTILPGHMNWNEFEFSSRFNFFVYSVNGFFFGHQTWRERERNRENIVFFFDSQFLELFWRRFTESREVFESSFLGILLSLFHSHTLFLALRTYY